MAPFQSQQTAASDDSAMDSRKRKRMLSNRESARRSRIRKQQQLNELINQVAQLKNENVHITMQIDRTTQQFLCVDGANAVLRTQIIELTERLKTLNNVPGFVEEFSWPEMDIQNAADLLFKPLQFPCPTKPVMAPGNMFHF